MDQTQKCIIHALIKFKRGQGNKWTRLSDFDRNGNRLCSYVCSMETTVLDESTWTHGLFLSMLANKLKGYKVTFF